MNASASADVRCRTVMESDMKPNGKSYQAARIIGIGILAALVLAGAVAIAPRAQTSQSLDNAQGIDVMSLGKNVRHLPEEQFPAH